jgi:hypothetical protein
MDNTGLEQLPYFPSFLFFFNLSSSLDKRLPPFGWLCQPVNSQIHAKKGESGHFL